MRAGGTRWIDSFSKISKGPRDASQGHPQSAAWNHSVALRRNSTTLPATRGIAPASFPAAPRWPSVSLTPCGSVVVIVVLRTWLPQGGVCVACVVREGAHDLAPRVNAVGGQVAPVLHEAAQRAQVLHAHPRLPPHTID